MELTVNGKRLAFFNAFELSLRYDAVASGFSFDLYFNPDNPDHRAALLPGAYKRAIVTHGGETLITGTLLSQSFPSEAVDQLVKVGGYSLPGVLEDCQVPVSAYPLQSDGLTLRQIVTKMLRPFGLQFTVSASVSADMDKVFSESTASESQSVKSYLSELAAQRNIIMSHDEAGRVVFTRADTNKKPVFTFDGEMKPATKMSLSFGGQQMHSTITAMKQADASGGNAGQTTVANPYVAITRPSIVTQSSGNDTDTDKTARAALASELRGVSLTIEIDRWDSGERIVRPGELVAVRDPKLYLYRLTKFFVEGVDYRGNESEMTATLRCVLPEVYNGAAPKNIFA